MTILGCGAALPLPGRNPTAQVVNLHEKQFLLDCGEGTQIALRHARVRMMRIDHIAISHLHGDHYLGLPGLVSTFNLLGRTRALHIYGPPPLKDVLDLHQEVGEGRLDFPLHFHPTQTEAPEVLFEDKTLQLESFPVKHRIPTTGFILREKAKEPGVKRECVRQWDLVPSEILALKRGEDVLRDNGDRIEHSEACHPVPSPRSYAYAADTKYWTSTVEAVKGVNLLYHEATFDDALKARAEKTYHSTASQAAKVAKEAGVGQLVIGHISARYDSPELHLEQAAALFPQVVAASDGLVLQVPSGV